jgi:hypothetical protein
MSKRFLFVCAAVLLSSCDRVLFPPQVTPPPTIVRLDSAGVALVGKIKGDVYVLQGQGHSVTNNKKADSRNQTAKKADLRNQSDQSQGLKSSRLVLGGVVLVVVLAGMGLLYLRSRPTI